MAETERLGKAPDDSWEPLAITYFLPAGTPAKHVRRAGALALANYEQLNTGGMTLQPAGVYVGENWLPAEVAAAQDG